MRPTRQPQVIPEGRSRKGTERKKKGFQSGHKVGESYTYQLPASNKIYS